jgi:hypothetical protein
MTDPNDSADPADSAAAPWRTPTTAKAKNAVQRAVTALLDELAPERVLKRSEQLTAAIEQHRTPSGCVLQAPSAAVSVSWFPGAGNDPVMGELRLVVWRGVVSRRGTPRQRQGATVVSETVFRPIEHRSTDCIWRAEDGTEYDTATLAALCTRLLDEQVTGAD